MTAAPLEAAETAARARDLRRMRVIATGLLVLMAVLFVAASLAARTWPGLQPWLGPVRAFAEAGMVGACADWFAVTALFRRPLGLPIPHTGIIPRNKDRIGEALGRFLAENFLTPEVLTERLRQLELARWGGEWLGRPGQAARLAQRVTAVLPEAMRLLPPHAIRDMAGSAAMAAANAIPAAPAASRMLAAAWGQGRSQAALDWGVARLAAYLAEHEEALQQQVEVHSGRWMPRFVDRLIAAKISGGLQDLLQAMMAPDHPWRLEIAEAIESFIDRLAHDPDLAARAETLKRQLLADPALHAQAQSLWDELEARLTAGDSAALQRRIEQALTALGAWLRGSDTAQHRLNDWARAVALRLIAPRRRQIGGLVADVVAGWDAKGIVDRLELQVGRDLQYIRINGTLVGGLVGLVLYAVTRIFGL
jgi:uncharacterized membrane-anchored protein YjiN (DUF445 family)